ncbi:MAG: hypothetical protein IPM56_13300 [Ignavibacteriales bacterium]|nr:MAG: hypothetical protein IPM56_13300 [Ignavibacteriales bacterium]
MSGKASLIVILGFSMLFMVIGGKFTGVSGRMTDNYVDYYNETIAHSIAVSGANLAANQIFIDPTWTDGYASLAYQNGTIDVKVNIIDAYKNIRQIVAVGNYNGEKSTVRVTLSPSKFSKFAYYSISEGGTIWWMARDTVWGPFHTQDYLRASKHPTFYGKASSKKSIIYQTNKTTDKPNFYGGYESGVDLPLPIDGVNQLSTPAQTDGLYLTGHDTIHMEFKKDSLFYKYTWNGAVTKVYLPTAINNGLIYANNAIVRLKGVVSGAYTVVSGGTSGTKGRIYLDDDIVYDKDPRVYPTSTDMLGIVAKEEVIITENSANNNDIRIHGSIYVEDGGFGAENYSGRPVSGDIQLLGGIIQNTRRAVSTFSGTTINHGFAKSYRYDERFMVASPPMFPGTGGFEIVSWYE